MDPVSEQQTWTQRYEHTMMPAFGAPKRVFVRGSGVHVWDADGRRYTDLLAGLAVLALGHAHPAVVAAVHEQMNTLGHISNFFASPPQIALGEKLAALALAQAPAGTAAKVFFANSGAEANEAAFKLTRLTGRRRIVAMEGAFHGRTMGALAVTWTPKYREPFAPLPGDVTFVPYGDASALAAAMDDSVAAIVVEPIQGENGVVPAPEDYLPACRQLADEHGSLLWIDEVQTGMGRVGDWFAHSITGVVPDIITVAKGLGNGFPIGACIGLGRATDLFSPGSHGTTFGGNPVACAAGLAVIDVIEQQDLLAWVRARGEHLTRAVLGLQHPQISGVRGRGLLQGITLASDIAPGVADAALDAGFIINAPRADVLRIAPPLIITDDELDTFVDALPGLLHTAESRR